MNYKKMSLLKINKKAFECEVLNTNKTNHTSASRSAPLPTPLAPPYPALSPTLTPTPRVSQT